MRMSEEAKRQRDLALDGWRRELRRLFELEKSQRERARQAEAEMAKQRAVVTHARDRYDRANDEYMNRIHHSKASIARAPDAARSAVHRPRA
jgi:hypothetical protein